MKKHLQILSLFILVQLLFVRYSFAQLDSIFDQGVYRTFIIHIPNGYTASNQYPLVVNIHGLNSNAAQQENYSQFDNVADTANFIVVYPNAISGTWTINGTSDVNFISHLIDTIQNNYSCNSCLFATGMSQGGFLTYKLACALPQSLNAIAVVSGNMSQNLLNDCVIANGLLVMHFHGTTDPIVNFNGTIGIPPVDTMIHWWVNKNNCNPTPIFTNIPDIISADSCTVEKYYYGGGDNGSEVIFYKIINGGHTWPGADPKPLLGFTNEDINASALIGSFFQQFCSSTSGVSEKDIEQTNQISIYPIPANNILTVEFTDSNYYLEIYDLLGRQIFIQEKLVGKIKIDCSHFSSGIYLVRTTDGKNNNIKKISIIH